MEATNCGITNSMDMSLSKLRKIVKGREAWCAAVHGVTKSRTQLSDWTTTANCLLLPELFLPLVEAMNTQLSCIKILLLKDI